MAARGRGLFSLYICIESFKNLLVRNHWTDFSITSLVIQFFMLVAKYFINMNRTAHKHLNFLEYKINVYSFFLSRRETALRNNKLQEFLQALMPVKEIWDSII